MYPLKVTEKGERRGNPPGSVEDAPGQVAVRGVGTERRRCALGRGHLPIAPRLGRLGPGVHGWNCSGPSEARLPGPSPPRLYVLSLCWRLSVFLKNSQQKDGFELSFSCWPVSSKAKKRKPPRGGQRGLESLSLAERRAVGPGPAWKPCGVSLVSPTTSSPSS